MANPVSASTDVVRRSFNEFGQPVGSQLPTGWTPPAVPTLQHVEGQYCRLDVMDLERDSESLLHSFQHGDDSMWTYLSIGPFTTVEELQTGFNRYLDLPDSLTYTITTSQGAVGSISYLRINAPQATIEIGLVCFSPLLQRTTAATEAIYLLAQHAFESGYRRLEWKHDALNDRSRAAAVRIGFIYEGTFRKAVVYKGRTRDTSWLSITDDEWPRHQSAIQQWLHQSNFDDNAQQRAHLGSFRLPDPQPNED